MIGLAARGDLPRGGREVLGELLKLRSSARRPQRLPSGMLVRQDIAQSVRAPFFQTEYEEWLYATHGGSLFLVAYKGRTYGLTCKHVFGDFDPSTLFISAAKQALKGS